MMRKTEYDRKHAKMEERREEFKNTINKHEMVTNDAGYYEHSDECIRYSLDDCDTPLEERVYLDEGCHPSDHKEWLVHLGAAHIVWFYIGEHGKFSPRIYALGILEEYQSQSKIIMFRYRKPKPINNLKCTQDIMDNSVIFDNMPSLEQYIEDYKDNYWIDFKNVTNEMLSSSIKDNITMHKYGNINFLHHE